MSGVRERVRETLTWTEAFGEATFDPEAGIIRNCMPIRAGMSRNGRFYPAETLRESIALFEGLPCFYDHPDPKQPKPLRQALGKHVNARWDEEAQAVRTDLVYPPSAAATIREIREKYELLGAEAVGLSVDLQTRCRLEKRDGRLVQVVEALIDSADKSCDVVFNPAAGGRIWEVWSGASEEPMGGAKVTETGQTLSEQNERLAGCEHELDQRLAEARLPERARTAVRDRFTGRVFEAEELERDLQSWSESYAASGVPVSVPGHPICRQGAQVRADSWDWMTAGLLGFFLGEDQEVAGQKTPRFRSFKQAYFAFEPETAQAHFRDGRDWAREALGHLHWGGGDLGRAVRGRESVSSGTFDQAWADVMQRVLMQTVADPLLSSWRKWVSDIVPFDDLTNEKKMVRIGDYGTFSTVAENGTYQPVSTPSDEQVSFGVSKYGGLETISWEAILRDDVGLIRNIPRSLGRAWAWTVHDFVYGLLQANAGAGETLDYDGKALYHADHSNIFSSTLTAANLATARNAMLQQTALNSGKRLNYRPKFLLATTPELDQTAFELLVSTVKNTAAEDSTVANFFGVNWPGALEYVPIIYPTATTTRWELVADPHQAQTMAVGFLNGRDEPEVFVQDMETVGSRFTADKITYKVRGTVGAATLDHRAFARGNS